MESTDDSYTSIRETEALWGGNQYSSLGIGGGKKMRSFEGIATIIRAADGGEGYVPIEGRTNSYADALSSGHTYEGDENESEIGG